MKRLVRFMCAISGEPFDVALSQISANKYQISSISRARATTVKEKERAAKAKDDSEIPSGSVDWSGFECPWCSTATTEGVPFVQCGRCRDLVCSGGVSSDEKGTFFECYPACGSNGYLSGSITSYNSYEESSPALLSSPPSKRLNAPPKRGGS